MPEGHTIRALGNLWERQLDEAFEVVSPSSSVALIEELDGESLTRVDTYGKHLFLGFGALWLHVHLGRFGKFYWHPREGTDIIDDSLPEPAASVRVRFVSLNLWVDLIGPIQVAVVNDVGRNEIISKLGVDPLRIGADPTPTREKVQASKRAIGALLMDQSIIAGIGNIYRAELLWRSRIDPHRPGTSISDELFEQLWQDTKLLLQAGVHDHELGEPTHTVGLPLPDGSEPMPEIFGKRNRTQVYQRAGLPCARCGATIMSEEMNGRTLFWCPGCQL